MLGKISNNLKSPWTDPNRKQSAQGQSLFALDGVRGLAVLIVVASHTSAFGMYGQGSLGVLLFFILSGFVLTLPFAEKPGRIFSWGEVGRFFANRTLRILPTYAVAVYYMAWYLTVTSPWPWIAMHLTFQGGWNHFWSVAEEAGFYLLFPFVVAVLAWLPSFAQRIGFLIVAILVSRQFQSAWTISLMDPTGTTTNFYFWFFLTGMLACLLYVRMAKVWSGKPIFGIVGIAIVLFIFLSSDASVKLAIPDATFSLNGWHQAGMWCALFGVLLFSAALYQPPFATWPMRHIGLLSFSLYLFHIPVLIALRPLELEGADLFFLTLAATYPISILSYVLIEKPFLRLKPSRPTAPPRRW